MLKGKDFFILTTNQDTQFVKLYPEETVAEIQGDTVSSSATACCTDETWDAVKPVEEMIAAMGDGIAIPVSMIPRCPHCGGEAFPWCGDTGTFFWVGSMRNSMKTIRISINTGRKRYSFWNWA